jgi:hypothetical protein
MKRSMIAVCLMLLSPGTAMACIEDHNTGAGWFDQQPSGWNSYSTGAQALHRDRLLDVAFFAGGLGALLLVGVSYRAMCPAVWRARVSPSRPAMFTPLALPVDSPASEPLCAGFCLDSERQDWSVPPIVDVYTTSIASHSQGIDSVASIGPFTWPTA